MKKKVIIGCLIVFAVIVILGGYRAYLIYGKYATDIDYRRVNDSLTLTASSTCDFTVDDISICLPEGFIRDEENSVDSSITVYKDSLDRRFSIAKVQEDLVRTFQDVDGKFNSKELLEEANISDTVDLLSYLDDKNLSEVSYFSSLHDVKLRYAVLTLYSNIVPEGDISYIQGDYKGYMIHYGSDYEINLIYNHMRYVIYFSNVDSTQPFTEDEILSIVGSIDFKK